MLPHLPVHGRRNQQGAIACETEGRKQIICKAIRKLGNEVGSGRSYEDHFRVAGKLDVSHAIAKMGIPRISENGIAR